MIITVAFAVKHRGYTMEFNRDGGQWYGHILHIKDLIAVTTERLEAMKIEAEAAIDDYIDTCEELGVEPNKPCGDAE